MDMNPEFLIEVETITTILEQLNYYDILKIPPETPPAKVKDAFFKESRLFHPDRYFGVDDATFKEQVLIIYKRIAEAYSVLKDPELRRAYDQQLASGEALRLDRSLVEQARGPGASRSGPSTPNGRKFLALGLDLLRKKDFNGAVMNLQFALDAEPGNSVLEGHLEEARKLASEQRLGRTDGGFKIRL